MGRYNIAIVRLIGGVLVIASIGFAEIAFEASGPAVATPITTNQALIYATISFAVGIGCILFGATRGD